MWEARRGLNGAPTVGRAAAWAGKAIRPERVRSNGVGGGAPQRCGGDLHEREADDGHVEAEDAACRRVMQRAVLEGSAGRTAHIEVVEMKHVSISRGCRTGMPC